MNNGKSFITSSTIKSNIISFNLALSLDLPVKNKNFMLVKDKNRLILSTIQLLKSMSTTFVHALQTSHNLHIIFDESS